MLRVRVFLCLLWLAWPGWASAQFQTRTRLLLEAEQLRPGDTVYAAVELQMPEGWHTYWQNPSDSGIAGQPTQIDWELPSYVSAGPIEWPIPTKNQELDDVIFTLAGRAILLVPLQVASNAPNGTIDIKAKVRWLECQKICVPGKSELQGRLTIGSERVAAADANAFAGFRQTLPSPQAFPVNFRWIDPPAVKIRHFAVSFLGTEGTWDFFPEPVKEGSFTVSTVGKPGMGGRLTVEKALELPGAAWPGQIPGVLVKLGDNGKPLSGYRVSGDFNPMRDSLVAQQFDLAAESGPSFSLMLLFAFVGGLILNIMPCVLPVIALKILGFVRQSHEQPGRIRVLGLAYGAGVLTSFLVLGCLVIAVKLAGKTAHQGLLFQSPVFLVGMTTLMVLIAMNLFGIFEVTLAGGAMDTASQLSTREGLTGAFFNGVLATVLATPCTAPFLGASIGFAVAQDAHLNPGVILLFFLTAGAGLALPYVALCLQPRWMKLLPKPGAWMIRFKMAMGFPMLATAAWLLSLAAGHYDADGLLWLGLFLVTIALGAWIFGEYVQRSPDRRWVGSLAVAGILGTAYFWMLESELNWREPRPHDAGTVIATSRKHGKNKLDWIPWSPSTVAAGQTAGRPVFVDFTADWCTTCQANKRTAIEVAPVVAMLKSIKAVTLLGDFTHEDPLIAAELQKHRRAGVPLVLVYSKDPTLAPRVLPEFLTRGAVLEALEWAANPK